MALSFSILQTQNLIHCLLNSKTEILSLDVILQDIHIYKMQAEFRYPTDDIAQESNRENIKYIYWKG